jgi:hypothetical protein
LLKEINALEEVLMLLIAAYFEAVSLKKSPKHFLVSSLATRQTEEDFKDREIDKEEIR